MGSEGAGKCNAARAEELIFLGRYAAAKAGIDFVAVTALLNSLRKSQSRLKQADSGAEARLIFSDLRHE